MERDRAPPPRCTIIIKAAGHEDDKSVSSSVRGRGSEIWADDDADAAAAAARDGGLSSGCHELCPPLPLPPPLHCLACLIVSILLVCWFISIIVSSVHLPPPRRETLPRTKERYSCARVGYRMNDGTMGAQGDN